MLTCPRTYPANRLGLAAVALCLLAALGCSRPPWPPGDDSGFAVLGRLDERTAQTESATYRVRWRSIGTEPHATFYLDIAFSGPDKFHVAAEGPFGLPAFTAVIVGDSFWFVDHQAEALTVDLVENLSDYEIPMSEFFSGQWRSLFSGGWGTGATTRTLALGLVPGEKRAEYETVWESTKWTVKWNHGRRAPSWVRAETKDDGETSLVAQTWFDHHDDEYPFWQMQSIRITGFAGGGEHRWRIIKQHYNLEVPNRLFKRPSPPRHRR